MSRTPPSSTRLRTALEHAAPTPSGHRWASAEGYLAMLAPGATDPTVSCWRGVTQQELRLIPLGAPELERIRLWMPETSEREERRKR